MKTYEQFLNTRHNLKKDRRAYRSYVKKSLGVKGEHYYKFIDLKEKIREMISDANVLRVRSTALEISYFEGDKRSLTKLFSDYKNIVNIHNNADACRNYIENFKNKRNSLIQKIKGDNSLISSVVLHVYDDTKIEHLEKHLLYLEMQEQLPITKTTITKRVKI